MKKRFSILLLLLTICFMTSHAQQMPITVTPIMTPPYTPSLSKMCESGSTSLMVNVFVNDVTASDVQLRLHLKLESTGITIESVSKAPVRPISVGGGEARVLMGSDLADVLSLNNLTFKGYDKAAYIKTGALPGGVWRLTAWLEHYHTGRILSNKGTAMAVIASYPPPVLTSPKNNEVTTGDMSKPIVFTWNASKFMGGTSSLLYTLEMWEMHTDGVPAEAVVASQSPIYTSAPTAGQSHTLIPTSLAMEPGRKYCWRMTVSDPSGKAHIQNGGRSEVRVFQYLEKCPDICELNVTVRDVTATATWDPDTRHKGGWNVEMYDDAGTYHETLWTGNNNTGEQIFDYGTKWHVRVQGVCQGGQVSAWSEWKDFQIAERFTTPKRDDGTPYECGEFAEPRVITNMEEKELKKGDIIENERGTTKYEIYSATKNDDGSYRGLSYIILSIWNCKVLGEYDNLRVNTDGVNISNFSWRSKKSDLLMADPDAIKQWTEELAKDIAGATYNNTIKETIKLDDISFETIVHKDGKYYAIVKDDNGNILEPVDITNSVDNKKRVAIEDKDGKQLVIDKDGEVMGVEEYKLCGGSKILLNENIKEKDAKVTKNGNVYFSQYGDTYLFDDFNKYKKHSAAEGYAKRFPSIGEGTYRPAYACTESNSEIQLKAEQYKTYTFKNERGVPVVCKDGILAVTARGDRDTTSIYAYDSDNNIVGKVNVLSYDRLTRKICLVPIGNVNIPDAVTIKSELDKQFAQLMVNFEVTIGEKIDIEYKDKSRGFIHGGSGLIGVYNKDQESAISKLKETIKIDDETCYLFLVECGGNNQLDANDKQTKSVAGYMPRAYQFGFIYNQYDNIRAISHELCHGAFHLKHTFADGDDHIAQEGSTDNLMDYTLNGKTLNHWQWQDVHLPKSVRFKWVQDEEDAEALGVNSHYTCISRELTSLLGDYRYFYLPDGRIIDIKSVAGCEPGGFYTIDDPTASGALYAIRTGDYDKTVRYNPNTNYVTSFAHNVGVDEVSRIAINKFVVFDEVPESIVPVRVLLDKDKVIIKGDGIYKEYSINGSCNCVEYELSTSTPTYFTNEDNVTRAYIEYATNNSVNTSEEALCNDAIVDELCDKIQNNELSNLGELITDKLRTYSGMNNRRFIVVDMESTVLCTNQKIWNRLAQKVFDKANLGDSDILITVPYVVCKGIGTDLGQVYFMPGMAHGDRVRIAVDKIRKNHSNTAKTIGFYINDRILPLGDFVMDVFTQTYKKIEIYKGIYTVTNSIFSEHYTNNYEDVVGYNFNRRLVLYKQKGIDDFILLLDEAKNKISDIDYEIGRLSAKDDINNIGQISAKLEEKSRLEKIYSERIEFLLEQLGDDTEELDLYAPQTYKIRLKEEFLSAENVKYKNISNAEAYIYCDAFYDLRASLGFDSQDGFDGFDFDQDISFTNWWDYKLAPVDNTVYNVIDGFGVALGIVGFDFIPDVLGLAYSSARGDAANVVGYSASIIFVGSEGFAVKKTIQNTGRYIIKKNGKGIVGEIAEDYVEADHLLLHELTNSGTNSSLLENLSSGTDVLSTAFVKKLRELPDAGEEFCSVFANAKEELIHNFLNNPDLLDYWSQLKVAHPKIATDIDKVGSVLGTLESIMNNAAAQKIGFDLDFLTQISGTKDFSYEELVRTCDQFATSVASLVKGNRIEGLDKVVNSLKRGSKIENNQLVVDPTGQSFEIGAEWVLRYIGSHSDEFAGKSLSFEVVEDINETLRRVDLVVPDEELGFVYYEFKSVKDVPPSHFLEQFSKDLANSKVTDLSQIRWIFDGKKVPADFKSKMLNEIKKIKMGNEVLSKFHYANEEELYKAISKKFDGIFIIANE